jgi:hypothetical protein
MSLLGMTKMEKKKLGVRFRSYADSTRGCPCSFAVGIMIHLSNKSSDVLVVPISYFIYCTLADLYLDFKTMGFESFLKQNINILNGGKDY